MAHKDEQHSSQESNWGETSQSSLTALQTSTHSLRDSSTTASHRPPSRAESVVAPDDTRAQTYNPNTKPDASKKRLGPLNYGSMASSHTRPPLNSPQPSTRGTPKKPSLGKRTSSAGPKRGQEFSVDDDVNEVQQDKASSSSSHVLNPKASTLRRRPTAQPPLLARVESDEREDNPQSRPQTAEAHRQADSDDTETTLHLEEEEEDYISAKDQDDDNDDDDVGDDDADLSDAESFTLKDRQEAINETHPFGIRIWKPALYKKSRSVQVTAEGDIHQTPG
ncbi:hypothetical protein KCU75_g21694, partial [Aureobasidium melanogenum]